MNPFEMVVIIVAVVTIGNVLRTRRRHRHYEDREADVVIPPSTAENSRLREEVQQLKQRIQVLERIAVEKENSLDREIDRLRDR